MTPSIPIRKPMETPFQYTLGCGRLICVAFTIAGNAFWAKALSAKQLASILKREHAETLRKCSPMSGKRSKCSSGEMDKLIPHCRLCNRNRCSCAWEYCTDDRLHTTTKGGTCYACVRTAKILAISRSPTCIIKAGALEIFLRLQSLVVAELGEKDVCKCKKCQMQWKHCTWAFFWVRTLWSSRLLDKYNNFFFRSCVRNRNGRCQPPMGDWLPECSLGVGIGNACCKHSITTRMVQNHAVWSYRCRQRQGRTAEMLASQRHQLFQSDLLWSFVVEPVNEAK